MCKDSAVPVHWVGSHPANAPMPTPGIHAFILSNTTHVVRLV